MVKYGRIDTCHMDALWKLQMLYKAEINEEAPDEKDKERLADAIRSNQIVFYGAWDDAFLIGCCSISPGFSTFNYQPSGTFEDFYICKEYRHQGIARVLVRYAWENSGVRSLTVGCADCDVYMYQALGFSIPLGHLLAFDNE